jgi:hypothetical protein
LDRLVAMGAMPELRDAPPHPQDGLQSIIQRHYQIARRQLFH